MKKSDKPVDTLDSLLTERDRVNLDTAIRIGRILSEYKSETDQLGIARENGITSKKTVKKYLACHEANELLRKDWAEEVEAFLPLDFTIDHLIEKFTQETFLLWRDEKDKDIELWAGLIQFIVEERRRLTKPNYQEIEKRIKASRSELLPDEIKEKVRDKSIPEKTACKLVKGLEELPKSRQSMAIEISDSFEGGFTAEGIEVLTQEVDAIAKIYKNFDSVLTLVGQGLDVDALVDEACQAEMSSEVARFITACAGLESLARKLRSAHKTLSSLGERLFVDSGANHPNIRTLLGYTDTLTQECIRIPGIKEDNGFSVTVNEYAGVCAPTSKVKDNIDSLVNESRNPDQEYNISIAKGNGLEDVEPSSFIPTDEDWEKKDIDEHSASVIEKELYAIDGIAKEWGYSFKFSSTEEEGFCWRFIDADGEVKMRLRVDYDCNGDCNGLALPLNQYFEPKLEEAVRNWARR